VAVYAGLMLGQLGCSDEQQPPGMIAVDAALDARDASETPDVRDAGALDARGDLDRGMLDHSVPADAASSLLRVFLAPVENGGDDGNAGTDRDHPIATLRRALAIVASAMPATDTEVLMAPGIYYNQDIVWTYTNPAHAITFKPLEAGSTVVFDGCANGSSDYANDCPDHTANGDADGHFFLLGSHPAGDTNLRFEHLEIRHYRNGIRFTNGASAQNRIAYCYFHHIGNGWAPNLSYAAAPGFGAVRSRNSSYNEFLGNRFFHIENVPGDCEVCAGHMHSYYLADSSDHNTFDDETHEYVSGGPVRFRNYSNHNVVRNSTFIAGGLDKGAVSDFYSETAECPCYDIQLQDNKVYGDWDCAAAAPVWKSYVAANTCTQPSLGARASGAGNCGTTSAPYCENTSACQPIAVNP